MRLAPVLVLLSLFSMIFSCADQSSPAPETDRVRLVVISPALGRIVHDLEMGDLVVGRHAWDAGFPGVPSVGDQTSIDYELLRRLEPTHVLLQWGDRPLPERLVGFATSEGWELANVEILTLEEIAGAAIAVAEFCGGEEELRRAEGLVSMLAAALSPRDGLRKRAGRVVALYGVSPLGLAGPGSFTFEMIERLGGNAVPDDGAAFIAMDPEDLRRLDPDTVVFFAPGADEEEQHRLTAPLERLDLRAAREGRVVFVVDEDGLLPSTSVIGAARETARRLMSVNAVSVE